MTHIPVVLRRSMRALPHASVWPLLLLLAVAGCTSVGSTTPTESPMTFQGTRSAQAALTEGRKLVEGGQHELAIPRLLHVVAKYPQRPEAAEAYYWLGLSYYQTNSYPDAIRSFEEYISVAPGGPYAEEADRYADALKEEYAQLYVTPDELERRIAESMAEVEQNPQDTGARLKLADLLWQRGDYAAAGEMYMDLLRVQPELISQETISQRVEQLPAGEYVLLTPAEIERRSIEDRPLLITNTNYFRSGEDLLTRESRFYVVSGQAHNRSDSILYGVQVHVTIYGFGSVIYDTATVNIGRLHPGERRAFSVRFSNFDNINNVARYECVGTYDR